MKRYDISLLLKYKTMKTHFSLLTALLLMIAGVMVSCEKVEDPAEYRLKKILHYSNSSSDSPTDGIEYTYNQEGNVILEEYFDYSKANPLSKYVEYEYKGSENTKMSVFEGKDVLVLSWYVNYTYANNQLIREDYRRATSDTDGWLLSSTHYEYKDNNKIREYIVDPSYGIVDEKKFTYDNQNRLIHEENDETDANKYRHTKHIFDNEDRKIKSEYYNISEELLEYIDIIYQGRSRLPIKNIHFDKAGNQTLQYFHYYDKKGNLSETRFEDECPLFKRKFDGKLLIEEILFLDPVRYSSCIEDEKKKYVYEKK